MKVNTPSCRVPKQRQECLLAFPAADVNSDHNMVIMKTKLKLTKIKGKMKQWNCEVLKGTLEKILRKEWIKD